MVPDLRLRNHTWTNSTMRPCRTMDEEGVTNVHVTCMTGRVFTRALKCRSRKPIRCVGEIRATLAIRCENAWDIQMRSGDDLSGRVIVVDVREEEQCQEAAVATVH